MSADPIAIARDLLRCRSVTPEEGGALTYLEGIFRDARFAVHRMIFAEPGTAPVENLYARIGNRSPHFVFAGHTDVVPPGDAAQWTHPPFSGNIAGGALYGRGAVDMKGAIACAVAASLEHLEANLGRPKGTLSFLITGDEEGVAVNGSGKLLQWAAEQGEKFDHCILGEPTNPESLGDMIKIGRRGSLNASLVVTGTQGHVAYPELADNPIRGLITIMQALLAEPLDHGSAHFEPSNLEFTTVDVGNNTINLIPAEARARFNLRYNDCHSATALRTLIEARAQKAAKDRIRWRIAWDASNAEVFLTARGPFVDLVSGAITDVTGRKPVLSTSGGTSDARFVKDYCPVVEFGLVNTTMHAVDERVATADLITLTGIYRRILDLYFA